MMQQEQLEPDRFSSARASQQAPFAAANSLGGRTRVGREWIERLDVEMDDDRVARSFERFHSGACEATASLLLSLCSSGTAAD